MSAVDLEKELENIKERVRSAVGSFQEKSYAVNEKAKEGGYYIELDKEQSVESSPKRVNPTRERLSKILDQQHNNFVLRNNLLSETCDNLHSIAPQFRKKDKK